MEVLDVLGPQQNIVHALRCINWIRIACEPAFAIMAECPWAWVQVRDVRGQELLNAVESHDIEPDVTFDEYLASVVGHCGFNSAVVAQNSRYTFLHAYWLTHIGACHDGAPRFSDAKKNVRTCLVRAQGGLQDKVAVLRVIVQLDLPPKVVTPAGVSQLSVARRSRWTVAQPCPLSRCNSLAEHKSLVVASKEAMLKLLQDRVLSCRSDGQEVVRRRQHSRHERLPGCGLRRHEILS